LSPYKKDGRERREFKIFRKNFKGMALFKEEPKFLESLVTNGPRYLFKAVDKKYRITSKILCDIGCSYGTNLLYCAPGSYGIEMDKKKAEVARNLGLKIFERDFLKDNIEDLPSPDFIWCSAVLEHVDSPFIFIKKMFCLLKPGGLLAIYVPTIPLLPWLKIIPKFGKYISGYNNQEHIYAFVPSTLKFICERAGFKTIEISPFYPNFLKIFNKIPIFNRLIGRCVYIGEKPRV